MVLLIFRISAFFISCSIPTTLQMQYSLRVDFHDRSDAGSFSGRHTQTRLPSTPTFSTPVSLRFLRNALPDIHAFPSVRHALGVHFPSWRIGEGVSLTDRLFNFQGAPLVLIHSLRYTANKQNIPYGYFLMIL